MKQSKSLSVVFEGFKYEKFASFDDDVPVHDEHQETIDDDDDDDTDIEEFEKDEVMQDRPWMHSKCFYNTPSSKTSVMIPMQF
jgi:hypothetical protein